MNHTKTEKNLTDLFFNYHHQTEPVLLKQEKIIEHHYNEISHLLVDRFKGASLLHITCCKVVIPNISYINDCLVKHQTTLSKRDEYTLNRLKNITYFVTYFNRLMRNALGDDVGVVWIKEEGSKGLILRMLIIVNGDNSNVTSLAIFKEIMRCYNKALRLKNIEKEILKKTIINPLYEDAFLSSRFVSITESLDEIELNELKEVVVGFMCPMTFLNVPIYSREYVFRCSRDKYGVKR